MVCAAVSVLAGTAFRVLPGREGIIIRGGAPEPGLFWIEADYTAGGRDFLFAAGEYLLTGLRFVAEEFPEYCTMTIRSERRT
jgi:uncharacterized protein YsxB (DUF464 family)